MRYLTVHCSATREGQDITASDIDKMHIRRGWSGIGYHFVITLSGEIQEGRPIYRTGAHVKGHNRNNIGICMVGGLDKHGKPKNTFTEAQFSSLRYLITDLVSKYGIKEENVKGHRDWFGDTNNDGVIDSRDWLKECPCFNVKDKLEEWSQ